MTFGKNQPTTCPVCKVLFKNQASFANHTKHSPPCNKEARFWAAIEKGEGCWLWTGRKDRAGYGRVDRKGPYVYAHRMAWMFNNGPAPEGLEVAHRCDVRSCCNPAHLFLATHDENMADCKAKGRASRGEKNLRNKLVAAQVREILKCKPPRPKMSGGIAVGLARQYGVGLGAIHAIWRGDAWAHIRDDGDNGSGT